MTPNTEISRKDYIATQILSSIISHNGVYEDCVEHALQLSEKLIAQLDNNDGTAADNDY